MARCSCGSELSQTSLTCPSCGKRMTLDVNQVGDIDSVTRVDWDAELDRLTAGELRPARVEQVPRRRSRWRRLFGRS